MGARVAENPERVQRFSESHVAHFIDFIISAHVCTDLPFGEKTLKLASGDELYVPNTIRDMGPTRSIDQYLRYCSEMCLDFKPLAESSLFKILDVCKASTRKSLKESIISLPKPLKDSTESKRSLKIIMSFAVRVVDFKKILKELLCVEVGL